MVIKTSFNSQLAHTVSLYHTAATPLPVLLMPAQLHDFAAHADEDLMVLQKLSCAILKSPTLFTCLQDLAAINQDFQALHLGLRDLSSVI